MLKLLISSRHFAHRDEEPYYVRDTHWNENGATLAAKVMAEQLSVK